MFSNNGDFVSLPRKSKGSRQPCHTASAILTSQYILCVPDNDDGLRGHRTSSVLEVMLL
jgi:hypothetical protein